MLRIQTHCEVMAKALNLKEEGGGREVLQGFSRAIFQSATL